MTIIISDLKVDSKDLVKYDLIYLNNVCDIKYLNSNNNIIILMKEVLEDGSIDNLYLFEEILISLNVDYVIGYNINDKLIEICSYYKVPLFKLK